jgi:hypothetical protein
MWQELPLRCLVIQLYAGVSIQSIGLVVAKPEAESIIRFDTGEPSNYEAFSRRLPSTSWRLHNTKIAVSIIGSLPSDVRSAASIARAP